MVKREKLPDIRDVPFETGKLLVRLHAHIVWAVGLRSRHRPCDGSLAAWFDPSLLICRRLVVRLSNFLYINFINF